MPQKLSLQLRQNQNQYKQYIKSKLQLCSCVVMQQIQCITNIIIKDSQILPGMQSKQQYLKLIKQLINKIWVLSTQNGYSYSQIYSHISCILVQQLSDHKPVSSSFLSLQGSLFQALQVNYRHVESLLIRIIQILQVQLSNLTECPDNHDAPIKSQSKFENKQTISQKNVQNLQIQFIANPEMNEQDLFEKIFNQRKRQERQSYMENYSQPSYQGVEFQNLLKIYEQMSNFNAQKSKYQFKQMTEQKQKDMEAEIIDRLLWDRQY